MKNLEIKIFVSNGNKHNYFLYSGGLLIAHSNGLITGGKQMLKTGNLNKNISNLVYQLGYDDFTKLDIYLMPKDRNESYRSAFIQNEYTKCFIDSLEF